jgi:hypothetical protein
VAFFRLGVSEKPTAAYLQQLVAVIGADDTVPIALRNACHRLILAINTGDSMHIIETFEQLRNAAEVTHFPLPRKDSKSA